MWIDVEGRMSFIMEGAEANKASTPPSKIHVLTNVLDDINFALAH
jgi:hypothetical protein